MSESLRNTPERSEEQTKELVHTELQGLRERVEKTQHDRIQQLLNDPSLNRSPEGQAFRKSVLAYLQDMPATMEERQKRLRALSGNRMPEANTTLTIADRLDEGIMRIARSPSVRQMLDKIGMGSVADLLQAAREGIADWLASVTAGPGTPAILANFARETGVGLKWRLLAEKNTDPNIRTDAPTRKIWIDLYKNYLNTRQTRPNQQSPTLADAQTETSVKAYIERSAKETAAASPAEIGNLNFGTNGVIEVTQAQPTKLDIPGQPSVYFRKSGENLQVQIGGTDDAKWMTIETVLGTRATQLHLRKPATGANPVDVRIELNNDPTKFKTVLGLVDSARLYAGTNTRVIMTDAEGEPISYAS